IYRARTILFVPFMVGIAHLTSCAVMLYRYEELAGFRWVLAPAFLAVRLLLGSSALFRRRACFAFSAQLYALGATLAMLCVVVITGGFAVSPFTVMLPLVVVFTFIMASIRIALLWASLGLLMWGIGINLTHIDYPNLIAEDWLRITGMITVVNAG